MSSPRPDARSLDDRRGPQPVVRQALRRFVAWSLLALVLLTAGTLLVANDISRQTAMREARLRGAGFGQNVAAPLVDSRVRAGNPVDQQLLASVMRSRMRDGSIVHIKIWAEGGRVIWADEEKLIGHRFHLSGDESALFGTQDVVADFSDLGKKENRLERTQGPLLEVYAGAQDADGRPIVFESYWSIGHVHADQAAIERRLVPLAVGSLLVFELAILPLALSLARRVDRAQAERYTLVRHALSASDLERRRLAKDLHDGLLQDLAGLGYALPSVEAQIPRQSHAARAVLTHAVDVVHRDMDALRTLLTDVYPADLTSDGLESAVVDLGSRASAAGLQVDVAIDPELASAVLPATQLTYQVLREGLRNTVRHAEATCVEVSARVVGPDVVARVVDDGRGAPEGYTADGHFGLRVLHDTVRDVGGRLVVEPRVGGGTSLTATFPLRSGEEPHA